MGVVFSSHLGHVDGRVASSLHAVARHFSACWSFPRSFSRAGHLQGIHGHEPLSVRVHGQEGVFQGHGAEQGWFPFFAEGDRRGKLLPFQPDDCPSLLSGYPPSVGQQGV